MAGKYNNIDAPPGQVWVCGACGKRSRDLYGNHCLSRWWDVSCVLNAVLCHEDKLTINDNGIVTNIADGGVIGSAEEVEQKLQSQPAVTAGEKDG